MLNIYSEKLHSSQETTLEHWKYVNILPKVLLQDNKNGNTEEGLGLSTRHTVVFTGGTRD